MSRILVIDNYDSFVFTIVGYLQQLGAQATVVRNDDAVLGHESPLAGYDGVLISPGPGTPKEAGESIPIVAECARTNTPLLGVCLGHQALGEYYGATVGHSPELMHGKTSQISHTSQGVFAGLPAPFTATRYHSLAVLEGTVPADLQVTATTENGIIMGLAHPRLPLHGVQFHPESVMTEGGHRLLANWLAVTGDDGALARSADLVPSVASAPQA